MAHPAIDIAQLNDDRHGVDVAIYDQVRKHLIESFSYDAFLVFGSLRRSVGDPDADRDPDSEIQAAFVSESSTGRAAAAELCGIGLALVEHGLDVECLPTSLRIHDAKDPRAGVELFHLYFDERGDLVVPGSSSGDAGVTRGDWRGTVEIDFLDGRVLVPEGSQRMLKQLYTGEHRLGDSTSGPGVELRSRDLTTPAERSKVYWTNFYARTEYTSGSTFSTFVEGFPGTPVNIIDIGCGDGRDSCAFGSAGRTALGIDQSEVGVEHAAAHAAARGVGERVAFQACDVADAQGFHRVLAGFRERVDGGAILYYMRFFLHAIPEDVQTRLMTTISEFAQPGDMLAAEFRTDKDAEIAKVHGKHYRRFQNAETFSETLRGSYGFEIVHEEEGTGLSPYGEEDPVLYRVIARR